MGLFVGKSRRQGSSGSSDRGARAGLASFGRMDRAVAKAAWTLGSFGRKWWLGSGGSASDGMVVGKADRGSTAARERIDTDEEGTAAPCPYDAAQPVRRWGRRLGDAPFETHRWEIGFVR